MSDGSHRYGLTCPRKPQHGELEDPNRRATLERLLPHAELLVEHG